MQGSQLRGTSVPQRALAFVVPGAIATYYALRGGSYDIVVRQEEALVVWWVLAVGFALGLLPRARIPRFGAVALSGLMLLVLWTALSLTWGDSDERALAELARVLHFGGLLLLVWAVVDRDTWRYAAAGLTVAAVGICAVALAARLAPSRFPSNDVQRALETDRINYPLNYWNALAAWGVASLAMVLAWSAHARTVWVRAASLGVAPLCALVVYLTYSRQGVAGVALALIAVLALSHNRWLAAVHALAVAGASALVIVVVRDQPEIAEATGTAGRPDVVLALAAAAGICVLAAALTRLARADRLRLPEPWGAAALAAILAAVLFVVAVPANDRIAEAWDEFRSDVKPRSSASDDPAARLTNLKGGRSELWSGAWRAFREEPARGVGAGGFEFWWSQDGGEESVRDAHSLYLEQLAELGVPGLVFTLLLLGGVAGSALVVRARLPDPADYGPHAAGLSALIVIGFHAGIDWMWEVTALTALGLCAGAVAAAAASERAARPRRPWRAALAVGAAIACLVQLPALVSTSRIRDSQALAKAGSVGPAYEAAGDAVETQPWAASPYVQRGLVHESRDELRAASADLRRAARREPTNWRHQLLLARVEAERGRPRQAVAAFRRARALRPEASFFEAVARDGDQ